MNTREIQRRVAAFKDKNGFTITKEQLPTEFGLLYGEVAEAFDAFYKDRSRQEIGFELADIAIYLMSIANTLELDLGKLVDEKMSINEQRVWVNKEKVKDVIIDKAD